VTREAAASRRRSSARSLPLRTQQLRTVLTSLRKKSARSEAPILVAEQQSVEKFPPMSPVGHKGSHQLDESCAVRWLQQVRNLVCNDVVEPFARFFCVSRSFTQSSIDCLIR